jgi:mono/diheme cytochrome c family protein
MHTPRRNDIGTPLWTWAVAAAAVACMPGCGRSADGTAPPAVDPAPSPRTPAPALVTSAGERSSDKLLVTEAEYQGWKYYAVYCERCHGADALGTVDAPDLRFSISAEGEVTPDSFRVIVRNGTENREMKGFEDLLDDQRIEQVYSYIKARGEGRLAAGRPHRAPGPQ